MGRVAHSSRSRAKKKVYHKSHKTDNRARDVDQIQDDLKKDSERNEAMKFEIDDDLPG